MVYFNSPFGRQERHRYLCEMVKQSDYLESLQNIPSPLSPQVRLGDILVRDDAAATPLITPLRCWEVIDPTLSDTGP